MGLSQLGGGAVLFNNSGKTESESVYIANILPMRGPFFEIYWPGEVTLYAFVIRF